MNHLVDHLTTTPKSIPDERRRCRYTALNVIASCALWLAGIGLIAATGGKLAINVQQSDDQTRRQLLTHTPLGTSADHVIDFVLTRLYYEGLYDSGVGLELEPRIAVRIGHRYDNPPFGHSAVEAYWKFNKDLRLRDIEIKRVPQEGGYSHSQDPDPRPKVKVDLRQSNKNIRQQILKETPLKSDGVFVEGFIGRHLYFQGGPANAVLLVGKRGNAVILGRYFDERGSKEMSVIVVWQYDENDRLREVRFYERPPLLLYGEMVVRLRVVQGRQRQSGGDGRRTACTWVAVETI